MLEEAATFHIDIAGIPAATCRLDVHPDVKHLSENERGLGFELKSCTCRIYPSWVA